MTTLPDALRNHLSGDVTSVCHCWKLMRADGVVLGFTDTDSILEFDGVTYSPRSGFSASEASTTLGLNGDTVDVEGALSSLDIVEQDVHDGRFDGARVDTWLVNWQAPDQRALIRSAVIGRMQMVDGRFVAELESIAASLDKPNARYFRRGCDAELGDAACGFDLGMTGYAASATVTAVEASGAVVVTGLETFVEGWFSHGKINWDEPGSAVEATTCIVLHSRRFGETRLILSPGKRPEAGAELAVVAGCDKRFATCREKFFNQLNFRGFPHLPGNDVAYGYVNEDLPLDGKPVVP